MSVKAPYWLRVHIEKISTRYNNYDLSYEVIGIFLNKI